MDSRSSSRSSCSSITIKKPLCQAKWSGRNGNNRRPIRCTQVSLLYKTGSRFFPLKLYTLVLHQTKKSYDIQRDCNAVFFIKIYISSQVIQKVTNWTDNTNFDLSGDSQLSSF